jgi:hypothetical protein
MSSTVVWKTPMVAFRGSNVRLCLMNFGKLPLVLRFSEEEPRGQGEFSWNSISLGADFISRGQGFQPNTREKRICRVLTKCPNLEQVMLLLCCTQRNACRVEYVMSLRGPMHGHTYILTQVVYLHICPSVDNLCTLDLRLTLSDRSDGPTCQWQSHRDSLSYRGLIIRSRKRKATTTAFLLQRGGLWGDKPRAGSVPKFLAKRHCSDFRCYLTISV